jgi:hypothetical protein
MIAFLRRGMMTPPFRQPRSTTKQAQFQWQTMVQTKALEPGWHDHLTWQLFAVATVRVSGNGSIMPTILEAHVLGNMERLYKARVREHAVDVRVAYEALAHMRLREAPPCELRIKTTDGTSGVTIDPPVPPSQEDWQALVEHLWSELRQDEELRLDWGVAPSQPGQSGIYFPQRLLLSRFRLFPHVQWEEMPPTLQDGQRPTTWQQELRLARDQFHPWVLHARVGWRAREDTEEVWAQPPPPPPEGEGWEDLEPDGMQGESDEWFPGNEGAPEIQQHPQQRAIKPLPSAPIDWQALLKRRGGLLLAGALLLAFIMIGGSVLTLGFLQGSTPVGPSATAITRASPTGAAGDQASPATQPTFTAATTPSPTAGATSTPTATEMPGLVVNWSVTTTGSTSQRCSPPHRNISSLTLTIDNRQSTTALTWQVTITDKDPAGKVWATASTTSGTVAAGQQAKTTLTPISSLCQDMANSKNPADYHAIISGSAAGQTKQVTITVTVKP